MLYVWLLHIEIGGEQVTVILQGLNGRLSSMVKNADSVKVEGDKIHIALKGDADSLVKGEVYDRAGYCIKEVFDD